jgi:uncharacterized protein with von Willebrand factor type A (vWA) domain
MQVKLGNLAMKSLSIDELWAVHEEVRKVLSDKILSEKRGLEERLARLNRSFVEKAVITHSDSTTAAVAGIRDQGWQEGKRLFDW